MNQKLIFAEKTLTFFSRDDRKPFTFLSPVYLTFLILAVLWPLLRPTHISYLTVIVVLLKETQIGQEVMYLASNANIFDLNQFSHRNPLHYLRITLMQSILLCFELLRFEFSDG